MAKFKVHKDCWAQTQYEDEGSTYIICVCGEYVKVDYSKAVREVEGDEEDTSTGTV